MLQMSYNAQDSPAKQRIIWRKMSVVQKLPQKMGDLHEIPRWNYSR